MRDYIDRIVSLAICRGNCKDHITGTLTEEGGLYKLGPYWFSKDLVKFIEETDQDVVIYIDRP